MLIKTISPSYYAPAEEACVLLRASSKGVELDKTASDADKSFVDGIRAKKGRTYLRLITVGAGEWFGANSKADYFNEKSREHSFAEPKKGAPCSIVLDGGLDKYHDHTYMNYGNVYVEHMNGRAKRRPKGRIVKARVNPEMHWGEVVVEIENDLEDRGRPVWRDMLDALSRGYPVQWSQGCVCARDICSTCGNVVEKKDDVRCGHLLKTTRLRLNKDGEPHVALTDAPVFHDISYVRRPAEIIAFTLQKVAGESGSLPGAGYASTPDGALYVPLSALKGLAETGWHGGREALSKLSALFKTMPSELSPEDVMECVDAEPCDAELRDAAERLRGVDRDDVLRALKKCGVLLAPRAFCAILLKLNGDVDCNAVDDELHNLLTGDGADPEVCEELLEDGDYVPRKAPLQPGSSRKAVIVVEALGGGGVVAARRAEALGRSDAVCEKRASDGAEARVAKEYIKYVLSQAGDRSDELSKVAKRNSVRRLLR